MNADRGLVRLRLSTKESGHLSAADFDVVGVAERTESGNKAVGLTQRVLSGLGLVEIARHADQDEVLPFVDADLRRSFCTHIASVYVNIRTGGIALNYERRHQLG